LTERATGRFPGRAPIEGYGSGGFRFAGMSHRGSILCLTDAIEAWPETTVEALTPASLARVLSQRHELDLVLLGTGAEHRLPPAQLRRAFAEAGLGLDVMATGPAARTYNILLAEGRRVAAALIAVTERGAG